MPSLEKILADLTQEDVKVTHQDSLLLAIQVIAAQYGFLIHREPTESDSLNPEERLVDFCLSNQWVYRRVLLESEFSLLTHNMLIGFHGKDSRPCIIELKGSDSIWYFPGENIYHTLNPETEKELLPVAYCFYESFPKKKLKWSNVIRFFLAGCKETLIWVGIVGLLVALFGLVTPKATEYVTGKIIPTANVDELRQLFILLVSLSTGTIILNLVPDLLLLVWGSKSVERFMAALYDRLFRIPVGFFHKYDSGELLVRMFSCIKMQESVFLVLSQNFLSSVFSLFSGIMLFYYSWKLALISLPMIFIYIVILYFSYKKMEKPLRIATEIAGWESSYLNQVFGGIAKIRGAGAEERIRSVFFNKFIQGKRVLAKQYSYSENLVVVGIVLPAIINLVFFWLIGKTWRGQMEVASFLAFLSAYGSFESAVVSISSSLLRLLSLKPQIERVQIFFDSDVETVEGKPLADKLDGSMAFSHVTFSYDPDEKPVLKDVSFHVKPGEFVAIVGPSGAGKSSLVRLMLGFEFPQKGTILYGEQRLSEIDVSSVRRQLGVILQNSRIMPGSIFDNITTGTRCTMEDAEKAASMAALDRDLAAMPMGMHTVVGDGLVSGGQQQRILIARALVGKPSIVIMDESTSALDNETQETVAENIESLNVTRIIIAHRLSTIINADRILVLDNGEIVEEGNFRELMKNNGLFKKLAMRQLL